MANRGAFDRIDVGELGQKAFAAVEMFRRWNARPSTTSIPSGGGVTPQVKRPGTVEFNRFRKRKKRKLSVHQKANAAYTMVKELMPRMKVVSFCMFDHGQAHTAYDEHHLYSGFDGTNTTTLLQDRSLASESFYATQSDVIPSGQSLCNVEDIDRRNMVTSAIFPLSHINLIPKGDNKDQRLGDFVEIAGMHITGRIKCYVFHPGKDANGDTPYGAPSYTAADNSVPHGIALDPVRKVRLMLIQVYDHVIASSAEEDANNDSLVYRNGSFGCTTTVMQVVGAPRLHHILDVPSLSALGVTPGGTGDRDFTEHGRWLKIDRKYRSNHRNENRWLDPEEGRPIDFKVLKDVSFTLKPDLIRRRMADTERVTGAAGRSPNAYVDVDMFVKLNADMSYNTFDADSSFNVTKDLSTMNENADKQFFWYLFDDHVDKLDANGSVNPVLATTARPILTTTVLDGYAMCQAKLNIDIFFNDDL